ncbi:peptidylprolyl isomerase [Bacillus timonensis]|uniref:Foldase protein PrsA n=1 Tax=Bacillus timonensis TaxID=1033734 RepID=A0A4S3PPG0_9BACI|nr:peptidylprolyl isomerase [Bacillus timonensis]THE11076.1 peptidylprolyl isomerase [Bacillus timonensis]
MKKSIIALTAAVGILGLSACNNADDSAVLVETKAGNVTKEELYNAMKDQAGAVILKDLVYTKVLSEKYEVTDKELDAKYKEMQAALGAQFDAIVEQNGEDFVRELLKSDMLKEKAALDQVEVKEGEVVKASHILAKFSDNPSAEVTDEQKAAAKKKIDEVKAKLDSGEKFEDVAKEYSDDSTAQNGGDLGWFGKGRMVPEFEEAAFTLKEGETSDIIESQYGYHIIKVTGTTEGFDKMDKEKQDEIRKALLQADQSGATLQTALDKAVKDADVKVKDKEFKDLFNTEAAAE